LQTEDKEHGLYGTHVFPPPIEKATDKFAQVHQFHLLETTQVSSKIKNQLHNQQSQMLQVLRYTPVFPRWFSNRILLLSKFSRKYLQIILPNDFLSGKIAF